MNSIYHEGEIFIQEEMKVRKDSDSLSSMFYDYLPAVASNFLKSLNFCIITFTREKEDIFSSSIYSINSFIKIIDNKNILIELNKKTHIPNEFYNEKSIDIGFIGLEFETQMRIRINGKGKIKNNQLLLNINQTYSNCPKFIYKRVLKGETQTNNNTLLEEFDTLNEKSKNIISKANTFFLGTSHKTKGVDTSHKGGKRGVIRVNNDTQIEFDDFPGNNMYNSLGNIHTNPYISILIIDYENKHSLHIKGQATIKKELGIKKEKLKVIVTCTNITLESNSFLLNYQE